MGHIYDGLPEYHKNEPQRLRDNESRENLRKIAEELGLKLETYSAFNRVRNDWEDRLRGPSKFVRTIAGGHYVPTKDTHAGR